MSLNAEVLALQPRHREELRTAMENIVNVRDMLKLQLESSVLHDMELVAMDLRRSLDCLGAVGGQMTPDDVIGKVFATFCVGK